MKTSIFIVFLIFAIQYSYANLYGVWQTGVNTNFGVIDTVTGDAQYLMYFPNFYASSETNCAVNNLTSVMTFTLTDPVYSLQYLVSMNVAKNKLLYFVPIPTGVIPYGIKYDSDVNSLKMVLVSNQNNSLVVGEMDPASASYDVYAVIQGSFISTGISTYDHIYYVVASSGDVTTLYSFDTRTGELVNQVSMILPTGVVGGPYNLDHVSSSDTLIGTIVVQDSNGNSGQDYATIDPSTGVVKPLGIYQASQLVQIVSFVTYKNIIYSVISTNVELQFVSYNIDTLTQLSSSTESYNIFNMGYFTNV
eukprot:gene6739-8355_t